MPPVKVLVVAHVLVILSVASVLAAEKDRSDPKLQCGAYCLYLGLRALDFPVKNYGELESKLGQPSPLGYSMEQLAAAAQSFGAKTLGVETNLDNLIRRPNRFVCIALLKQGHFVNVYDVAEDRVYFADPPELRQAGLDAFRSIWTGKALLISDKPIPDEASLAGGYGRLSIALIGGLLTLSVLATAAGVRRERSKKKA